jgi:hypothetical protein
LPKARFHWKYGFNDETLLATAPKLRYIGQTIEEGTLMLILVRGVAIVFSVVSLSAFAASGDCGSIIKLRQHSKNGLTQIDGRNSSGKSIVAYVVVDTPQAPQDYRTLTFRGLFTNGDSMRPGSSMNLGSLERRKTQGSLFVDYVRLADGTTCGKAESSDAKTISTRFTAR